MANNIGKRKIFAIVLSATFFIISQNSSAQQVSKSKLNSTTKKGYLPYFQIGGTRFFSTKTTNSTAIAADLLIPLWQLFPNHLIFTDLRLYDRTSTPYEGNLHLGYRYFSPEKQQIYGIYGAFDRKRTGARKYFNQLTFGVETWFNQLFIGGNFYQPVGSKIKYVGITGEHEPAEFHDGLVSFTQDLHSQKALGGIDGELGYEIIPGLVGYAGGYYFKAADVHTVFGPKARLTYDWYLDHGRKILGILDQVGLEAGIHRDKPRGTIWYLNINIRLGLLPGKNTNWYGVQHHMLDLIRRDVDIVVSDITTPHQVFLTENGKLVKYNRRKPGQQITTDDQFVYKEFDGDKLVISTPNFGKKLEVGGVASNPPPPPDGPLPPSDPTQGTGEVQQKTQRGETPPTTIDTESTSWFAWGKNLVMNHQGKIITVTAIGGTVAAVASVGGIGAVVPAGIYAYNKLRQTPNLVNKIGATAKSIGSTLVNNMAWFGGSLAGPASDKIIDATSSIIAVAAVKLGTPPVAQTIPEIVSTPTKSPTPAPTTPELLSIEPTPEALIQPKLEEKPASESLPQALTEADLEEDGFYNYVMERTLMAQHWGGLEAAAILGNRRSVNINAEDFENEFLYDDATMRILMAEYFEGLNHVAVLNEEGTVNINAHNGEVFLDALQRMEEALQRMDENEHVNQLLIPINIGHPSPTYVGHWAGIIIYRSADAAAPAEILYFDPLGSQVIPSKLQKILRQVYPKAKFAIHAGKLQQDSYNCGPWVIELMRHIVNNEVLPEDIQTARRQHRQVVERYNNLLETPPRVIPASPAESSELEPRATSPFISKHKKKHTELWYNFEMMQIFMDFHFGKSKDKSTEVLLDNAVNLDLGNGQTLLNALKTKEENIQKNGDHGVEYLLIPTNFGTPTDESQSPLGRYWAGTIIHRPTPSNVAEIIYFDPAVDPHHARLNRLKTILLLAYPNAKFKTHGSPYQNDGYNCGPRVITFFTNFFAAREHYRPITKDQSSEFSSLQATLDSAKGVQKTEAKYSRIRRTALWYTDEIMGVLLDSYFGQLARTEVLFDDTVNFDEYDGDLLLHSLLEKGSDTTQLLIPLNLGNYWVGIRILRPSSDKVAEITYFDPLDQPIPEKLSELLKLVYPNPNFYTNPNPIPPTDKEHDCGGFGVVEFFRRIAAGERFDIQTARNQHQQILEQHHAQEKTQLGVTQSFQPLPKLYLTEDQLKREGDKSKKASANLTQKARLQEDGKKVFVKEINHEIAQREIVIAEFFRQLVGKSRTAHGKTVVKDGEIIGMYIEAIPGFVSMRMLTDLATQTNPYEKIEEIIASLASKLKELTDLQEKTQEEKQKQKETQDLYYTYQKIKELGLIEQKERAIKLESIQEIVAQALCSAFYFEDWDRHKDNFGISYDTDDATPALGVATLDYDKSLSEIFGKDKGHKYYNWTITPKLLKNFPKLQSDCWYWPTSDNFDRKLVSSVVARDKAPKMYSLRESARFSMLRKQKQFQARAELEWSKLLFIPQSIRQIVIDTLASPQCDIRLKREVALHLEDRRLKLMDALTQLNNFRKALHKNLLSKVETELQKTLTEVEFKIYLKNKPRIINEIEERIAHIEKLEKETGRLKHHQLLSDIHVTGVSFSPTTSIEELKEILADLQKSGISSSLQQIRELLNQKLNLDISKKGAALIKQELQLKLIATKAPKLAQLLKRKIDNEKIILIRKPGTTTKNISKFLKAMDNAKLFITDPKQRMILPRRILKKMGIKFTPEIEQTLEQDLSKHRKKISSALSSSSVPHRQPIRVFNNPRHRLADISTDTPLIRWLKLLNKTRNRETLRNEIIPRTAKHSAWSLGAQLLEPELAKVREEAGGRRVVRVSMVADRELVKIKREKSGNLVRLRWFDHGTLDETTGKNQTARGMREFQKSLYSKLAKEDADVYCHCLAGRSRSFFETIAYIYFHPEQAKLLDVRDPQWERVWEEATKKQVAIAMKAKEKRLKRKLSEEENEKIKKDVDQKIEGLKARLEDHPSITDIGEFVRLRRPKAKPLDKLDGDQGGLLGLLSLNRMTENGCQWIKERALERLLRDAQNIGFMLVAPLDRGFREENDLKEQVENFMTAYQAFQRRGINLLMAMVVPISESVPREYKDLGEFNKYFTKMKPSQQARLAILLKTLADRRFDLSPLTKEDALIYAQAAIDAQKYSKHPLTAGDQVELLRAFGSNLGLNREELIKKIREGNAVDRYNAEIQLKELKNM